MQPIPRLLVNLLVILVKTPVNLLVKPTKSGLSPPQNRGCPWGLGPGNTLGRGSAWGVARTDLQLVHLHESMTIMKTIETIETNETIMRLLLGILLELLGILLILPDLLGFYYMSNTIGKTIGNIS